MQVIYTQAGKFAGAGIGTIAYYFVRSLYCAGFLKQAIVAYENSHDIPKQYIRSFPWMRFVARVARDNHPLRDTIFDKATATQISPADIFHGWSHQCLHSLQKAKNLGAVTFVERQNSHDAYQYQLVQQEYDLWGFDKFRAVRPLGLRRGLSEFELADFITVPSKFVYDSFLAEAVDPQKLFLVPYGVDTQKFFPPKKKDKNSTFRLLFVGQVSLRKGVPYLLQAWQKIKLPRAELWLAGRIVPSIQHIISPYLSDPTINFLGHVTNVLSIYHQADAFILPSIEEGSALVTYEAMACGLPLIYTFNTGAVARDGIEGLEIPIRDVFTIAEAIEKLYQNASLRQDLGQAGIQRVKSFTWQLAGQQLIQTYQTALQRKEKS